MMKPYTSNNPGSRNLIREPGPYYHRALWRFGGEPLFSVNKKGEIYSAWKGNKAIQTRPSFTVDDLIDYFYDQFGSFSPQLKKIRRAADIGAVNSLLQNCSLDQLLFAIDIMWQNEGLNCSVPSLIRVTYYMQDALERYHVVKSKLKSILSFPEVEGASKR